MLTGLCGLVFISGTFFIDRDEPTLEIDKRVDWFGAFLIISGIVLVMFVLGQGELATEKWRTPCM